MTTIAWDGLALAADKRTSFGGLHATTTKVHRIHGSLVACAGNAAQIREFVQWLFDGAKPAEFPGGQRNVKECISAMVISPTREILQYENTPYPIKIENRVWAIGSGRDFAMAAMYLGQNAREAIELASALDLNTGNGVDVLTLDAGALP